MIWKMKLFQDILQNLSKFTKTFDAESELDSVIDISDSSWSNSTLIKMLLLFKRINKVFVT